MITLMSYVDFVLKFTLAFGLVFEMPVVITLLSLIGVVTRSSCRRTASTPS